MERYDYEERKTLNGTLRVDKEKFKNFLKRVGTIALSGTLALTIISGIVTYRAGYKKGTEVLPGTIPSGYVLTQTQDEIDFGGSVSDTASNYYSAAIASIYDNFEEYTRVVEEMNGLRHNEKVDSGETITLPVAIDELNPHYIQTLVLQSQINQIQREEYWVQYVVKSGDTISGLAAKASGSRGETVILTNKILEKNPSDSNLRPGDVIWIVNPKLGPLKLTLQEEEEAMRQDLKNLKADQAEEEKSPQY